MQREVPSRPPSYDGKIMLFGVAKALQNEEALCADLAQYGRVVACEIRPSLVELAAGPGREIAEVKAANAIVCPRSFCPSRLSLYSIPCPNNQLAMEKTKLFSRIRMTAPYQSSNCNAAQLGSWPTK